MLKLLYCEILKLKRTKLLMLSIIGVCTPSLLNYLEALQRYLSPKHSIMSLDLYLYQVGMFLSLYIGSMTIGIIATSLYNSELSENTLKSVMVTQVSRGKFILSKMILLFFWVILLMLLALFLSILLGLTIKMTGFSYALVIKYLKLYLTAGILIYMLTPFIILINMLLKNFAASICIMMICLAAAEVLKRTYAAHIFPWTIPAVISSNMVKPLTKFPVGIESYIIIIALFIFSVVGSYIYINKMDIQ